MMIMMTIIMIIIIITTIIIIINNDNNHECIANNCRKHTCAWCWSHTKKLYCPAYLWKVAEAYIRIWRRAMAHRTTSAMEPVALRLKASPDLPVILYSPRICARLQPCKEKRKEYVPHCRPANHKGKDMCQIAALQKRKERKCTPLSLCLQPLSESYADVYTRLHHMSHSCQ